MRIKGIVDEDFVNYKLPSMYIVFPSCTFKCDKENGCNLCQNSSLVHEPDIEIDKETIIERYLQNPITQAIVLAGLEPFDSKFDLLPFVNCVRVQYKCNDPIIIYTGYTEDELENGLISEATPELNINYWQSLKQLGVIVKFGRFRPNENSHYDEVLGVWLASKNQYAKEYVNEFYN